MHVCRLCLEIDRANLLSVKKNSDLTHKIKECVTIEIADNDDLPDTVCISCIQKVKDWYLFKQICLKSNATLVLKNDNIKQNNSRDNDSNSEEIKIRDDKEKFDNKVQKCNSQSSSSDICCKQIDSCMENLDHQLVHSNKLPKCDNCTKVSLPQSELPEQENHTVTCPMCGKLMQKRWLQTHLKKHSNKFKCSECPSRMSSKHHLKQHIATVHSVTKHHICGMCNKAFSSQSALNTHTKSHFNERKYKCAICDYAGRTASALYTHNYKHNPKICICEVCSKTFRSIPDLNKHIKLLHKSTNIKKHQCEYCDKKFQQKDHLEQHLRTHTGVRPYHCHVCEKTFAQPQTLKEHTKIHGERTFYVCDKCGKKFVAKKSVMGHQCTGRAD